MFSVMAVLGVGSLANAAIVIPTNQNGADAEMREFQTTVDLGGNVSGVPQGASQELATRGNDTTTAATGDRSSVMYMKFDISSLPAANDPFWSNKEVILRGHVRNNNLPQSRVSAVKPGGDANNPADFVRAKFNVGALEPGNVYADDDPNAANKTDRSGNAYVNSENKYNWDENDVSFYSAPGITPHCMIQGACGADPNNIVQTLGVYDDFNSDVRMLGSYTWPNVNPQNHLAVGAAIDTPDLDIKQLVLDAKNAGRSHVTLIQWLGNNTLNPGSGGTETPASLLAFNYLWIPKEMTTLNNDTNYDPNTTTPNFPADPVGDPVGSPYSCTFDAVNRPQCTGQGNNTTGRFSPQLIVRVPEPTSIVLLGLGALVMGTIRRRK